MAALFLAVVLGRAEEPSAAERVEAAVKITRAAAAEYDIRIGSGKEKPLQLHREPLLKWSNPEAGHVHGNLYVWTRDGRPLVAGCLFNWFSPRATVMEHEFHSLAEKPLSASFHKKPVWKTGEAGLSFADIPGAAAPAASDAQRLFQMKQLAREFSASGNFGTNVNDLELRLLPQPLHRYAAPERDILAGGVFALVRATDPEILLLIEARGKDVASARWQFAAARMHSMAELRLRHRSKTVWEGKPLTFSEAFEEHELPYTAFRFKQIPEFLRPENRER
jgi:hypothetical protein